MATARAFTWTIRTSNRVLDRAAALNVPIYLHPTIPPAAVIESCYAGFSDEVTFALATVGWGWHINTATHLLRLILGGVFDRPPGFAIQLCRSVGQGRVGVGNGV